MGLLRAIAFLLILLPGNAVAGPYDALAKGQVLHGWATENGTHMAAIHLDLAPGWKTYWRSPGDAGIPPQFHWRGSRNVKSVRIHWPVPRVFDAYGLRTIGYEGSLTLPVEIVPIEPGRPIRLRARMELGICKEICVPATLRVAGDLDPEAQEDVAPIRAALLSRPATARQAGIGKVTCRIAPVRDGYRLSVRIPMARGIGKETAVIELPGQDVWISEAQIDRQGGVMIATSDIVATSPKPVTMSRSSLIFTVIDGQGAVEIRGCQAG